MVQVLHLSNGDTLNPKLAAVDNWITHAIQAEWDTPRFVEELFGVALVRKPTAEETQRLVAVAAEYPEAERRQAWEDLVWSVLTSTEFTFNH
jgi:hypothetical protein